MLYTMRHCFYFVYILILKAEYRVCKRQLAPALQQRSEQLTFSIGPDIRSPYIIPVSDQRILAAELYRIIKYPKPRFRQDKLFLIRQNPIGNYSIKRVTHVFPLFLLPRCCDRYCLSKILCPKESVQVEYTTKWKFFQFRVSKAMFVLNICDMLQDKCQNPGFYFLREHAHGMCAIIWLQIDSKFNHNCCFHYTLTLQSALLFNKAFFLFLLSMNHFLSP